MAKDVVPFEEKQLLEKMRIGDGDAVRLFYKLNYGSVSSFIVRNSGTEQEAKDIFQEAVIIFFERLKEPDFELTCSLKTFVYSVCRRLWLKRLSDKGRNRHKVYDFQEYVAENPTDIEEAEKKERQYRCMEKALEALGEPCRTILTDFYVHKLSMQEITERFGYTNADNAKNQKYKCLQRLKKLFFTNTSWMK